MKMGEKIKALRKQNGLTMEELARMLGLQKSAINKYEHGTVVNIKMETLNKMAEIFGVAPSDLMDDVADDYFSNVAQYVRELEIHEEMRKALWLDEVIDNYKYTDTEIDMVIGYARLVAGKK